MRGWLIKAREDKGMTQQQLANALKLTRAGCSSYELGKRTPKPEIAKRIAEILGFDWTKFYE